MELVALNEQEQVYQALGPVKWNNNNTGHEHSQHMQ